MPGSPTRSKPGGAPPLFPPEDLPAAPAAGDVATTIDKGHGRLEKRTLRRTTLLTKYHPVGCRFYFYASPYEAVADIRPHTFATRAEAFNAMVLTARTGDELITERNFVRGVTGISFRTKYFGRSLGER